MNAFAEALNGNPALICIVFAGGALSEMPTLQRSRAEMATVAATPLST